MLYDQAFSSGLSTVAGIGKALETLMDLSMTNTMEPTRALLASGVLLSGVCAILGQYGSKPSISMIGSTLVGLGFALGTVLTPDPLNKYFLIGVLFQAAYSLFKAKGSGSLKIIALGQIGLAILLVLLALFAGNSFFTLAGLFLAVTLVPLFPFHLPFAFLIGSTQGPGSGFWLTIFLFLGLGELHEIQPIAQANANLTLSLMALVSAVYASCKCLGQAKIPSFIAYATIAQVSLMWGLITIFSNFSEWGIPHGVTIALTMNGLLMGYSFIHKRYGHHVIGTLSGLALSIPRLGLALIMLISIAMLFPIFPTFSGLATLPMTENQDVALFFFTLIAFTVWMFGSWYFSHFLHQTAFGRARPDIPYNDLKAGESWIMILLILGAGYAGFIY